MEQSTASRFALNIHSFSCSLCNQLNSFLRPTSCKYTLTVCCGILSSPRVHSGPIWYRLETVNILRGRSQLVRTLPLQNCSTGSICTRGKLQRDVGDVRICVVIVMRQITCWKNFAPIVSISLFAVLIETSALEETLGSYCQTIAEVIAQDVEVRETGHRSGSGNRRNQARQVTV